MRPAAISGSAGRLAGLGAGRVPRRHASGAATGRSSGSAAACAARPRRPGLVRSRRPIRSSAWGRAPSPGRTRGSAGAAQLGRAAVRRLSGSSSSRSNSASDARSRCPLFVEMAARGRRRRPAATSRCRLELDDLVGDLRPGPRFRVRCDLDVGLGAQADRPRSLASATRSSASSWASLMAWSTNRWAIAQGAAQLLGLARPGHDRLRAGGPGAGRPGLRRPAPARPPAARPWRRARRPVEPFLELADADRHPLEEVVDLVGVVAPHLQRELDLVDHLRGDVHGRRW